MTMPASSGISHSGWTCAGCGQFVEYWVTHYCSGWSAPATNIPLKATMFYRLPLRLAWTCPVCGNGCAPHVDTCSHAKTPAPSAPVLDPSAP
jgi:hypothetical protein